MNSPCFLDGIKQEAIVYNINSDGKKNLNARHCIGKGYTLEQANVLVQPGDEIGVMYYLKDTQYVVIDIDSNDYTPDNLFNDSGIDSVVVKGNTKGYHIWMLLKDLKVEEFKRNKVDCGLNATIDFLGEKVFERIGKDWNGDEPQYLNDNHLVKTFKPNTFQRRITNSVSESQSSPENLQLLKKIVNLIDIKYCDNRDDWLKILLAMKKCGMSFEEADKWSQSSGHYTLDGVESAWNSYSDNRLITVGQGTLRYYAKQSNLNEYYKLCPSENYFIKTSDLHRGAFCVANVISPKLKTHLKWSADRWWMYYSKTKLWTETKEPSHLIVSTIHKHLDYSIKIKTDERANCPEEDEEKIKLIIQDIQTYSMMYAHIDKPGFYSMIIKHLKTILYEDDFYLKLDNNPYQIAFQNGLYDIRNKKFTYGYTDLDYITKTIPYDYEEPTAQQLQFVKNVIYKICNCNQQHLNYYLGVLGQALLGDPELEKALYFCVGHGGNNGKTLILDTLSIIMPNYVSKIDRKTFEKGYSKSHKHLTGTKGKRICYVEELSKKAQDIEMLKEIADGKTIKNEILFGTDETINIMFKLIFLSNNHANLTVDGGIENRFRQLSHYSKFNKDTVEDNYDKLDFVQDKTLADKLKSEYKFALITLILDAAHNYTITKKLIIPDEFIEATNNALEINDEVKCWFNENCEVGTDFKCSKKDIESALTRPLREIQSEISRITNLKYIKDLRFSHTPVRGGWKGFKIVEFDELEAGCQVETF